MLTPLRILIVEALTDTELMLYELRLGDQSGLARGY